MENINIKIQDLDKLWQLGLATGWESTFYFGNDTTLLKIYNEKISAEMKRAINVIIDSFGEFKE